MTMMTYPYHNLSETRNCLSNSGGGSHLRSIIGPIDCCYITCERRISGALPFHTNAKQYGMVTIGIDWNQRWPSSLTYMYYAILWIKYSIKSDFPKDHIASMRQRAKWHCRLRLGNSTPTKIYRFVTLQFIPQCTEVDMLRPRQDSRHLKDIFKCISFNEIQRNTSGKARKVSLKLQNSVHFHAPYFTNHVYFTPHDRPPLLKGHHLGWPLLISNCMLYFYPNFT